MGESFRGLSRRAGARIPFPEAPAAGLVWLTFSPVLSASCLKLPEGPPGSPETGSSHQLCLQGANPGVFSFVLLQTPGPGDGGRAFASSLPRTWQAESTADARPSGSPRAMVWTLVPASPVWRIYMSYIGIDEDLFGGNGRFIPMIDAVIESELFKKYMEN